MKRTLCIASVIVIVCALFWLSGMGTYAEGETFTDEEVLRDTYAEESREWWQSIRAALPEEVAEEMNRFENGEGEMGFEYLFSLLLREVKGESGGFFRCLVTLLGVTVLGGVAGMLCEASDGVKKPLGLVLSVSVTLVLWNVLSDALARAQGYLQNLAVFAEGLTPVMTAVLAGGGAANGAATTASGMATLIAVLEVVVGRVLAPLIAVSLAFSLVNGIADGLRIDGIAANMRGIYMTIIGIVGVVATGAVTLQSVLASSADSMAMRTAKYTVGNMIPIIGGSIGAALGTLGSSLTVIKSSIGVGSIIAILLLALPLLFSLLFTRLALNISASVARMMGFEAGEKLLGEFRGAFDMTLAVVALSGTLFLIYIAVFLKTALPMAL